MADLDALVLFAKVVEANGFSKAARRLHIPVSTVSRRIAELEDRLGMRLLERSTRNLRLTDFGAEILDHARRGAEVSEAVDNLVSNQSADVSGMLRLSAPPSVSDTLVGPLAGAFQASYPNVRIQVLVTDRMIDHIAEGVDLAFRLGALKDSALIARKLLTYRHRLVASPEYLRSIPMPRQPNDLLEHRLIAFSHRKPQCTWTFRHAAGNRDESTLTFTPYLAMNDFAGLIPALLAGGGIGDLPPIVQPGLVRDGRLVEVMPEWHFQPLDLSLVHLGNRHISRPVRLFKEFATQMAPNLFPDLPV